MPHSAGRIVIKPSLCNKLHLGGSQCQYSATCIQGTAQRKFISKFALQQLIFLKRYLCVRLKYHLLSCKLTTEVAI